MEAGRAVQRGLVTPDRTTFIVSTNRVYSMTEKIALADGRVDSGTLLEGCRAAARRLVAADMAQLAEATGSVISAVLFGALAGAKALPIQRMAFEAAIHRGGVGVKQSIAAFGAGFAAAEGGVVAEPPAAVPAARAPAALAPLMAETNAYPEPAAALIRAGIDRLADYQDVAYARDYLDRLKAVAEADRRHGAGGRLLAETARELALGMTYEDTVRVAELKIRPSRFARVRAEVQAADGQIMEIAEFLHPRVQEIADTLPAGLGRWLLNSGWPRRFIERRTRKGRVVKTSTIRGFLLMYVIASMKPTRRRSLRFAEEQRFLKEWLATILNVAAVNGALATEIATTRTLVKGYSDTHERGRRNYDALMRMLPQLMETPDPAGALARLRKAALADDSGEALAVAIKELRPLAQAAE
jgi:indolepyruvate ferredoxin oxidoreductase beta subunit